MPKTGAIDPIPVVVVTDGACSGNPGPGGWAAILRYTPPEKVLQGGASLTTNNRMELRAAIAAFQAFTQPCDDAIVAFVQDAMIGLQPFGLEFGQRFGRVGLRFGAKSIS